VNVKKRCVFCLDEEHLAENFSKTKDAGIKQSYITEIAKCLLLQSQATRPLIAVVEVIVLSLRHSIIYLSA